MRTASKTQASVGSVPIDAELVRRLRAFKDWRTQEKGAAPHGTAQNLVMYGHLPSYRAMLDRKGLAGPADLALVGDEKVLDAGLARMRDAGVTDFIAALLPCDAGADKRTLDYLQSRL